MPHNGVGSWPGAMNLALLFIMLVGCAHRVQVEAPEKPIVINLNVRIEQDVRVKVEDDIEELLAQEEDLF